MWLAEERMTDAACSHKGQGPLAGGMQADRPGSLFECAGLRALPAAEDLTSRPESRH